MDNDTALELVKRGGALLLLDVPQFTLIGIDTQMFSSGPNFKGIKMIPPGVHFVYYSSANREGVDFSPVIGFFVDFQPSQVIVRKWDESDERFSKLSEEEEERYAEAVKRMEFDGHMGPYDFASYGDWKRLSNYITKDTLDRIEPIMGGEITVASEADIFEGGPKSEMEKALDDQLKSSKFSNRGDSSQKKGCYYTEIPRIIKHKGMTAQELTNLNLDKTQLLESLLSTEYGGVEDLLLAELQFAFIAFLMAQSIEAFLQWKALINLLLGCTEAPLHTRSRLFIKVIRVLFHQLQLGFQKDQQHSSGTHQGSLTLLDESWLSTDSFLYHLCKDFFSLVLDAPMVDGDLLTSTRKLKQLLEDTLRWKFQQDSAVEGIFFDEDDEYAPVVVG